MRLYPYVGKCRGKFGGIITPGLYRAAASHTYSPGRVLNAGNLTRMIFSGLLIIGLLTGSVLAAAWRPVPVPLMTRWGLHVRPHHVWVHYPRPQMRRKIWKNLNGLWNYSITSRHVMKAPQRYQGMILVPFPVDSSLSGVGKILLPSQCIWYHRSFTVPTGWRNKQILLHIEASNWETWIYVDGHLAIRHRGGYSPIRVNITRYLKSSAVHQLTVRVWDPAGERFEPRGKQVLRPHGMYFTESSGIWGTVWLEPVHREHITSLVIRSHVRHKDLSFRANVAAVSPSSQVHAVLLDGKDVIAVSTGVPGRKITLSVPHPHLWSPRSPFLYALRITLTRNGKVVDTVSSYAGMRSITIGPGVDGRTQILLNGKPVFQRGFLYQGYWPDGLYTPPGNRAMRYDIMAAKRMGYNMFRVHQIVEPRRFYYLADRLGYLIWQDMPAAWPPGKRGLTHAQIRRRILAGGNWGAIGPIPAYERREYRRELTAMIRELRNDPSIVVWTPFNEGWGIHNVPGIVRLIHRLDPSRLIDADSGVNVNPIYKNDYQIPGNIVDIHHYPGPRAIPPSRTQAASAGECGGVWYPVAGHFWPDTPIHPKPDAALALARYRKDWQEAWQLRRKLGISAIVFTELMDQEQEIGGLLTYDRVTKFPFKVIRRITLGH